MRATALAGADLIVVPTAQMQPFEFVADTVIPARAWENQVYLAYANHIGDEGTLRYVGRSAIYAPDGSAPAGVASADAPELLVAQINPTTIAQARAANPYLADRRPALYRNPATDK